MARVKTRVACQEIFQNVVSGARTGNLVTEKKMSVCNEFTDKLYCRTQSDTVPTWLLWAENSIVYLDHISKLKKNKNIPESGPLAIVAPHFRGLINHFKTESTSRL